MSDRIPGHRQRSLAYYRESNVNKDDTFAKLTIYDIPAILLKEFARNVAQPYYEGDVVEAILDVMRKAVEEQKKKSAQLTEDQSIARLADTLL